MLIRIWKVALAAGQGAALEHFAHTISLPMFRRHAGCLGVFFNRDEQTCVTVTLWRSEADIAAMEATSDYQAVVAQIEQSGILGDDHHTELYTVYGGFVSPDLSSLLTSV
ncbi:hypothetical protein [Leeia sp.]|uniref:hypothetical protein n=1 Tax=Leeia sp. TaxID=2884678 RepID=UPI0035B47152